MGSSGTGGPMLRGVPRIPRELRRRLEQYRGARSAQLSSLADDGQSILITTRFAQTEQVHLVQQPLGARRQLTFEAEPVRRASFVPGQSKALIYRRDTGGNERFQLYRLDVEEGKTEQLTDGRHRHGDYLWSPDGRQLAYVGSARSGHGASLYLSDGKGAAGEQALLNLRGHYTPLDWSWNGRQLVLAETLSANERRLHLVDLATRSVEPITAAQPAIDCRVARFTPDGRRLYVTSDREGEFTELYELDLTTKQWRPLSRGLAWNVEEIALAPDGKTLAFTLNEAGYSALYLLDTSSRRSRRISSLPRGVLEGLRFARRAPVLGFTLITPTHPGDAYTFDLRHERLVRWTASESGAMPAKRFVEPSLIRYPSFDGRQIPAFYYRPAGSGPFPVLIRVHGGPEVQARPVFSMLTQIMVGAEHTAVLVPNVRGSDGYGKSYLQLDNETRREDAVRDIGALLDWIATQPDLDARHVAVHGGSYGGYLVLASLVRFGNRIAAGIEAAGISNFVTFLRHTAASRRDLRRVEYGDERDPRMRAFLERISPLHNASRIRSALFVAHGVNDPRVPLGETEQIARAVERQGQVVWMMVARNEGHGFRKQQNRDLLTNLTVLFLRQYLRPTEP